MTLRRTALPTCQGGYVLPLPYRLRRFATPYKHFHRNVLVEADRREIKALLR